MSRPCFRLALCAALCLGGAAHGAVIDFNSLANPDDSPYVDPLVIDGYRFTNACAIESNCLFVWGGGAAPLFSADPNGATVVISQDHSTTTLARDDGASFDFLGLDVADAFNQGDSVALSFTFSYAAGGSSTQTVTTASGVYGLQHLSFTQTGLSQVSWVDVDDLGYHQFDNVVVTAAAAVPEPASGALLGGGLALLGALARRRASRTPPRNTVQPRDHAARFWGRF